MEGSRPPYTPEGQIINRLKPEVRVENYDRAFWTPERISANVESFFQKLERNERIFRARSERLFRKAIRQEAARKVARKAIAERQLAEDEAQRRNQRRLFVETGTQRRLRHSLEWMLEQQDSHISSTALGFLFQIQNQNKTVKQ